jgi:hypothetical protein
VGNHITETAWGTAQDWQYPKGILRFRSSDAANKKLGASRRDVQKEVWERGENRYCLAAGYGYLGKNPSATHILRKVKPMR